MEVIGRDRRMQKDSNLSESGLCASKLGLDPIEAHGIQSSMLNTTWFIHMIVYSILQSRFKKQEQKERRLKLYHLDKCKD